MSAEDIVKCEERYLKSKTVASILRHVASKIPSVHGDAAAPAATPAEPATEKDKEHKRAARKARQTAHDEDGVEHDIPGGANEDEKLEQLYDTIGWPLGKKYGHPYDAFKLALTYAVLFPFVRLCPRVLIVTSILF